MALEQHNATPPFTYHLLWWGEAICGTETELRALGLGDGRPFPDSADGRTRPLRCTDPRGLPCRIRRERGYEDRFVASIEYPGRELPTNVSEPFPGVNKEILVWGDLYMGSSAALIAAGLVRIDQLPGAPGMPKTCSYFDAEGRAISFRDTYLKEQPGSKSVRKCGRDRYTISVQAADDDGRRMRANREEEQAYHAHVARFAAMPRPAPLVAQDRQAEALRRRAQLRLVWSRPAMPLTIYLPE